MLIIYDLIFLLVAFVYLIRHVLKRKFHRGMLTRFGFFPKGLKLDNPIWVHAVSVGEAVVVKGLIEILRKKYPEKKIVITTVTATGNKIAKTLVKEGDFVTYFPFDLSFIVRKVINKISPSLVVIAETEIWPNFISILHKKIIPVIVVNGRISDKSFRGYSKIKFFIKPILNKINLFCVQTKTDSDRLMALGVREEKIQVTGNMKFDAFLGLDIQKKSSLLRHRLKIAPQEKVLVAGSTHQGEEDIILAVFKNLKNRIKNLRLIIAPRHPERAQEVKELVIKNGLEPVFISQLPETGEAHPEIVFILDTVGQLVDFYAIADIVFVGGSLIEKGGHNILEPAALEKPVIFGPHMFNFRDITDLFIREEACIMVNNQQELEENIFSLLNDAARSSKLTERLSHLIKQNQGATARNMEYVGLYL